MTNVVFLDDYRAHVEALAACKALLRAMASLAAEIAHLERLCHVTE
jgi:hypothetical protein